MGFQLGPKVLRTPPKGWLRARAFPIEHSAYEHSLAPQGGERVIQTSARLTVTWRVEIEGCEPYDVSEERTCPSWLLRQTQGGGKRWYTVRVRPSFGLMAKVGVPCVVDPSEPTELWIDWDAAYQEHVPAWERHARIKRGVAQREGTYSSVMDRITNPLAGRLKEGEEVDVDRVIAEEAERAARTREHFIERARERDAAKGITPAAPGESDELRRQMDELTRIQQTGRRVRAKVVDRSETDRTFASVPVILLSFDLDEGDATPRRVVFEHHFGPRHAKHYKVGKEVDVWIDPRDPDVISPGR